MFETIRNRFLILVALNSKGKFFACYKPSIISFEHPPQKKRYGLKVVHLLVQQVAFYQL